jgi:DNA-binding NarL/FixJ family response regulator
MIRIILADDHEIFRDGIRYFFEREREIELVAEAANGMQLLQLTALYEPDVILTDIQMPEMNGIEATKILSERHPDIAVIALTSYDENYCIIDMLDAGAKGYLLKDAHKTDIIEAITTVNKQQHYYCKTTEQRLKKLITGNIFNPVAPVKKLKLSSREQQVLKLICDQKCSKEISDLLKISIRTVEIFRKKLIIKTGSINTAGLVLYAVNNRLLGR